MIDEDDGPSLESSFGREEFKVLYYLVVDKYSLGLLDLVLKPSVFVDSPYLAEKYLLRFRIRRSKRFPGVQPAKYITVLEMDQDETVLSFSEEVIPG